MAVGRSEFLGLALHPNFPIEPWVYVFVSLAEDGRITTSRLYRLRGDSAHASTAELLLDSLPANDQHVGGALAFGADGMLYVSVGEAGTGTEPHDWRSLAGKVLRIRPDGSIPPDNPRAGSPVFAAGFRNVQGLAWHKGIGALVAVDHGPTGGPGEGGRRDHDELNVVRAGRDYGWPTVAGLVEDSRFELPLADWTPAIVPAGIAVYRGEHTAWRDHLFVTMLHGGHLRRIAVSSSASLGGALDVSDQEGLFAREFGRLRAITTGADGHLYFATSNRDRPRTAGPTDDRVFRFRLGEAGSLGR